MFFFRKPKFFLDLTDSQGKGQEGKAGQAAETKVTLAPPSPTPVQETGAAAPAPAPVASAAPAPEATPAAAPTEPAAAPLRTTAEEIAAQLAAEAASRPAPTLSTFSPDCLVPGAATPRRRRKAGANLGAFKEMAKGMMKS